MLVDNSEQLAWVFDAFEFAPDRFAAVNFTGPRRKTCSPRLAISCSRSADASPSLHVLRSVPSLCGAVIYYGTHELLRVRKRGQPVGAGLPAPALL